MSREERFLVLKPADRAKLLRLEGHDAYVRDVLQQLERILASETFARVQQRTRDFLRLVVALKLLQKEQFIKEKTIAIPDGTQIVTIASATKDDLKPGAAVIVTAEKAADGSVSSKQVSVGLSGVQPM